jgi:hypothetical protein
VASRLRAHLTYANIMVTILAFIVLAGGTAYAVVAGNQVNSASIIDGQVKAPDLHDESVGSNAIEDQSVSNQDLRLHSVRTDDIAPETIQNGDLKPNSVDGDNLRPNAIPLRVPELASFTVPHGGVASGTARCGTGSNVISGGYSIVTTSTATVLAAYPSHTDNGYHVLVQVPVLTSGVPTTDATVYVAAYCVPRQLGLEAPPAKRSNDLSLIGK